MVSRINPERARKALAPNPEILTAAKHLYRRTMKDAEDLVRAGEARTHAFVGGEVPRLVQGAVGDVLGELTARLEASEAAVAALRAELADARDTAAASVAALAGVLQNLPVPVVNNHVPVPSVTVEQPTVTHHIHVPEQAAPVVENHVHVPEAALPTVTVEAGPVTVNVPEQAAPDVHVAVNLPRRRTTKHIAYDAEGRPVEITETEIAEEGE